MAISKKLASEAFKLLCTAKAMTEYYEANFKKVSKYVHATSRGHEVIQLAVGMQLTPKDFAFPYYRDDAFLLGMGFSPKDLILQLLAKADDPFSMGRSYYSHPSARSKDKVQIPHQSSATGMQAIPATGAALGIRYKSQLKLHDKASKNQIVVCSLGDASITEGEVAEAFQMASLKELPILFVVQDNEWDISAYKDEVRSQNASEYIQGFVNIKSKEIDGSDMIQSFEAAKEAITYVRKKRKPFLLHAHVPLLNHHTSGVRMEWYRDDLEDDKQQDPYPKAYKTMQALGFSAKQIQRIIDKAIADVSNQFAEAEAMPEPDPANIDLHAFAPTAISHTEGIRSPEGAEVNVMVDCALHAIEELMQEHKECLLYGQDVGIRLGGVFREAATLASKFGSDRVFNTPIQEAFIVGSTVGMSAVGLKPIVEVQFADYIWPGLNQLFTEVSRSNYLSGGKWPVSMILRVPCGAYGSGGPYHSSSVESILTSIKGIKIAYPSNGADLKGLMKSAYYDPNPVVILEHKGLYWSKVPHTDAAKVKEPDADYKVPFGKCLEMDDDKSGDPEVVIITYGMGVHWALRARKQVDENIKIIDLRTLYPLDEENIYSAVKTIGKCLLVTEEPIEFSFIRSLAGQIQEHCFEQLDAPIKTIGAMNLPAIPINSALEATMLPNADKVLAVLTELIKY